MNNVQKRRRNKIKKQFFQNDGKNKRCRTQKVNATCCRAFKADLNVVMPTARLFLNPLQELSPLAPYGQEIYRMLFNGPKLKTYPTVSLLYSLNYAKSLSVIS